MTDDRPDFDPPVSEVPIIRAAVICGAIALIIMVMALMMFDHV